MKLKIFQVDAFASELFEGNPAAVVPLEKWLPDKIMQKIALENNLSETAFFIPKNNGYQIRWFTPLAEVDLCGHATLASAHVLFHHLNYQHKEIHFDSRSGLLKVIRNKEILFLDFPTSTLTEVEIPQKLKESFHFQPVKCFKGREDYMLVYNGEAEILALKPDFQKIGSTTARGIIVTSPSEKYDFVSRFFAPAVGVYEDPVTGSAHTMLIPFWASVLGKDVMTAKQVSRRGGIIHCKNTGERVEIGGQAVTYMVGEIYLAEML